MKVIVIVCDLDDFNMHLNVLKHNLKIMSHCEILSKKN